jgi:uncharacterized membrane protein
MWILLNAFAAGVAAALVNNGLRDFVMVAGWGGCGALAIMTLARGTDLWCRFQAQGPSDDREFHEFAGASAKVAHAACGAFVLMYLGRAPQALQVSAFMLTLAFVLLAVLSTERRYRDWQNKYYGNHGQARP